MRKISSDAQIWRIELQDYQQSVSTALTAISKRALPHKSSSFSETALARSFDDASARHPPTRIQSHLVSGRQQSIPPGSKSVEIVSDLRVRTERPKVAAHCPMRTASVARPRSVLIDNTRPDPVGRISTNRPFARRSKSQRLRQSQIPQHIEYVLR